MKKIVVILLSVILILSIIFSGCTGSDTNAETGTETKKESATSQTEPVDTDPFGKYDPVKKVTLGRQGGAVSTLPEGDSMEENVWTRSLKEDMGIEIVYDWIANGDAYDTKVNLCIASNQLPDILALNDYSQFDRLVRSGRVADLTNHYSTYASPVVKKWYEEMGGITNGYEFVNGRMYGFSRNGINYQSPRMIHIRRDWFEETGLPEPKTMQDVMAIGSAMKAKDPENRYIYSLEKIIIGSTLGDLVGMANSMGVYPRIWTEENGKLVYGSIQPGMKKVLEIYAQFYKEGLIDPEFAIKDYNKLGEQIAGNKAGIIIGNFNCMNYPLNSLYKTSGVEWNSYPILPFSDPADSVKVQTATPSGGMFIVNKNYSNPEILFKILNYETAKVNDPATAEPTKFHSDGKYIYHTYAPVYPPLAPSMTNFETQKAVTGSIDKNDTSLLKTPHAKTQYETVKKYFDAINAKQAPEPMQWTMYKYWYGPTSAFAVLNSYFDNKSHITSKLVGFETLEMTRKKLTLEQLEDTVMIEVITGLKPLSAFDEFVTKWRELGGEVIEYEVNDWYKTVVK